MKINSNKSDDVVLAEVGQRLTQARLAHNWSQKELANEAGVSKSTIERLEAGQSVKSSSLIRLLRALDLLDSLDSLVPEALPSPVERLQLQGRRRRRASAPRGTDPHPPAQPWRWGDDDDGSSG
jgi:putative transcriptional regulator